MVAHFHHPVLERSGQDDICQGCPGLESIMSHKHKPKTKKWCLECAWVLVKDPDTDTYQFVLRVAIKRVAKLIEVCLKPQGMRIADHDLKQNAQTLIPPGNRHWGGGGPLHTLSKQAGFCAQALRCSIVTWHLLDSYSPRAQGH